MYPHPNIQSTNSDQTQTSVTSRLNSSRHTHLSRLDQLRVPVEPKGMSGHTVIQSLPAASSTHRY